MNMNMNFIIKSLQSNLELKEQTRQKTPTYRIVMKKDQKESSRNYSIKRAEKTSTINQKNLKEQNLPQYLKLIDKSLNNKTSQSQERNYNKSPKFRFNVDSLIKLTNNISNNNNMQNPISINIQNININNYNYFNNLNTLGNIGNINTLNNLNINNSRDLEKHNIYIKSHNVNNKQISTNIYTNNNNINNINNLNSLNNINQNNIQKKPKKEPVNFPRISNTCPTLENSISPNRYIISKGNNGISGNIINSNLISPNIVVSKLSNNNMNYNQNLSLSNNNGELAAIVTKQNDDSKKIRKIKLVDLKQPIKTEEKITHVDNHNTVNDNLNVNSKINLNKLTKGGILSEKLLKINNNENNRPQLLASSNGKKIPNSINDDKSKTTNREKIEKIEKIYQKLTSSKMVQDISHNSFYNECHNSDKDFLEKKLNTMTSQENTNMITCSNNTNSNNAYNNNLNSVNLKNNLYHFSNNSSKPKVIMSTERNIKDKQIINKKVLSSLLSKNNSNKRLNNNVDENKNNLKCNQNNQKTQTSKANNKEKIEQIEEEMNDSFLNEYKDLFGEIENNKKEEKNIITNNNINNDNKVTNINLQNKINNNLYLVRPQTSYGGIKDRKKNIQNSLNNKNQRMTAPK